MQPENLEARVTALEVRVRDLTGRVHASEHDAAAARVLAGAADRDVTEIRDELREFRWATVAGLNALRQGMTDGFRRVDERFAHINERFTHIDERFTHIDERFAHIDEQFAHVDERFTRIDEQFVRIEGEFGQVGNGFAEMRAKFDVTAAGQQEIVRLVQTVIDAQGGNAAT